VTAASVANKDLAADGVFQGNPAILIRQRVMTSNPPSLHSLGSGPG
jgi:hypothetical protein